MDPPTRSFILLFSLASSLAASPAPAWIYPEHRDIALLAVENLDPERKAEFEELWHEARTGNEGRLCEHGADATQGVEPACIDWAAMSAIAGDHSCSAQEMLQTVLATDWILDVANIGAQLKRDLAEIPAGAPADQAEGEAEISDLRRRMASQVERAQRINALRTANTRLEDADPEYATRAGYNNAHFMLARPSVDTDQQAYVKLTLQPGSEVSAIGIYVWYHMAALQQATRLANEQLTPDQRQALARSALVDEAFALHFLEDMFAAGHVAGTWGDASQRKGTHDYYNEAGLLVFTWEGHSTVLMGDAHMRPQDADAAAKAVRLSLEQVLDTAVGRSRGGTFPYTPAAPAVPDAFDVCHTVTMSARPEGLRYHPESAPFYREVLLPTAVPSLGPGLGAMPRFRTEVGPFAGVAASLDGRYISGGFAPSQNNGAAMGELCLSARGGFGLEGVMGEGGDGLMYLQLGVCADSPSSNKFSGSTLAQEGGTISAAVPSRYALTTRIRMPFYLLPGDLLFLSPMYFFAHDRYIQMAVTAANGGRLRWQLGWASPIGRFQFVLGRELGVNFYGLAGNDRLLVPAPVAGDPTLLVDYNSIAFDVPVAEYRPYRDFTSNQSSTLLFQLISGVDVPNSVSVVAPARAQTPDLRPLWYVGLRFGFDWRYYF